MRSQIYTLLAIVLTLTTSSCAKEPKTKTRTNLKYESFQLDVFDNSETYSNLIAINNEGHVLGYRELEERGVYTNEYFFDDGQKTTKVPDLEGYTNTEPIAISDSKWVAGFASRPMGSAGGGMIGIAWDVKANKLSKLPPQKGDLISHAYSISKDGKRIAGYTTGSDPARTRPCVWDYDEKKESWVNTILPTEFPYNPSVVSGRVLVSPNGQIVVACVAAEVADNGFPRSFLSYWKIEDGEWAQNKISDDAAKLYAINDKGLIAAEMPIENYLKGPFVFELDGTKTRIELLKGGVSGAAQGINAEGVVVGVSNEPHGEEGGPHAFVWKNGKTTPLDLPKETYYSLAAGINDSGQIAGYADVTFPGETTKNEETGEEEPVVKAVGLVWTSSKKASSK